MTSSAIPIDPDHAIVLGGLGKHFQAHSERRRFSIFGGLAPRRRTLRALDSLDLSVPRGEMLGVIGMNGSGKSTLLKVLSGITQPTVGSMDVRGQVGSLIELGAGFHPDLSGYENVYLNGSLLGMERAEIDTLIGEIVEYAGLEDYMDLPVKHFSMGMTLRLGFAIATQIQPDILLLDETMSVGDIEFQARALRTIQDFRERGTTILLVSHDVFTVREQCDRVLWLHEGHARQIGPPTEVVDAYCDYLTERAGQDGHEMLAMHGDSLYNQLATGEPPVEVVRVETLDDAGAPTTRLDHPARVTLAVHWRARHATDDACFRIAMIRRENQAVVLERNSIRDGIDTGPLEGEGTVRFSFEADRFYSDAFRFIAAVGPTDEKEGVWDRATTDFDIENIEQLMPGWFCYLTNPCRKIEHRAEG